MAAYGERTGVDWQDWNKLTDPKIVEFSKKVSIKGDPQYGVHELNKVEVKARNQTFKAELPGFTAAMDQTQLIKKFRHNASRNLIQPRIDMAIDAFLNLDKVAKVSQLMSTVTL
jgi:hypothetical protein